ncbi:GNAT family N-acetyltransferase [Aspergillus melleus]|uniref:GNAT family N-acetyltransferase n=1 Tax=Aspergillus melleus TaxID=138277 RepID=UPI001E8CFF08|nr:uncharacterized protein LDX57_009858 [Aspergillus melleus]KAH8432220.1 hypothetical protein LDX57_009858 [Aspergillus melleus]
MAPPPPPTTTPYTIKIYTSSQLSQQPALVDELSELINESFLVQASHPLGRTGLRLEQPGQLIDELGPSSLTAVYFHHPGNADETTTDATRTPGQAIGTASIKAWEGGKIWNPVRHSTESDLDPSADDELSVDGDFEAAIVAVKPSDEFRGRGIADKLVDACEQAILQKWIAGEYLSLQPEAGSAIAEKTSPPRPIKIMVKVVKEITASYWAKKGFVTVVEKRYGPGTWGIEKEFTISAMVRELPVAMAIHKEEPRDSDLA